jgi:hypothetical protein
VGEETGMEGKRKGGELWKEGKGRERRMNWQI